MPVNISLISPSLLLSGRKYIEFARLIPLHPEISVRKHWRLVMRDRVEAYLLMHKKINVVNDGTYDFGG